MFVGLTRHSLRSPLVVFTGIVWKSSFDIWQRTHGWSSITTLYPRCFVPRKKCFYVRLYRPSCPFCTSIIPSDSHHIDYLRTKPVACFSLFPSVFYRDSSIRPTLASFIREESIFPFFAHVFAGEMRPARASPEIAHTDSTTFRFCPASRGHSLSRVPRTVEDQTRPKAATARYLNPRCHGIVPRGREGSVIPGRVSYIYESSETRPT